MADKRSSQYPYQWPNGTWHSIPWAQYAAQQVKPAEPFKPPPVPAGRYDPALDAQRGAASRGLLNTEQDIGLAGRRAEEDLGFETTGIERDFSRGMQDFGTQRGYAGEDYNRNVAMLTRNYTQLGRRQAEQGRRFGVTSGGIALLSAAKRAENQALERSDVDTGYNRQLTGFTTGENRLGEDRTRAVDRSRQLYDRGVGDRGTALERARSEDLFFGLDIEAQKNYQAQQGGYLPPTSAPVPPNVPGTAVWNPAVLNVLQTGGTAAQAIAAGRASPTPGTGTAVWNPAVLQSLAAGNTATQAIAAGRATIPKKRR